MGAAVPVIMIAATLASTAVAAAGTVQQAEAAKSQAKFREQVAKNNAIIAEQNAQEKRRQGRIAEAQQRLRTLQEIGAAQVHAAGRGVLLGGGSVAAKLARDLQHVGQIDAGEIRRDTDLAVRGIRQQARDFEAEASVQRAVGRNAETAGQIALGQTLAEGATSVSSKWYDIYR